jgi:hypothetical protein
MDQKAFKQLEDTATNAVKELATAFAKEYGDSLRAGKPTDASRAQLEARIEKSILKNIVGKDSPGVTCRQACYNTHDACIRDNKPNCEANLAACLLACGDGDD